jgi:hypothetical protein
MSLILLMKILQPRRAQNKAGLGCGGENRIRQTERLRCGGETKQGENEGKRRR